MPSRMKAVYALTKGGKTPLSAVTELPVQLDLSSPVPVKVDKKRALNVLKKLNTPTVRRTALAVGGVAALSAIGNTTARYKFYQGIVSRELKKQLAPLHQEIAELQASVDALQAQLDGKAPPKGKAKK